MISVIVTQKSLSRKGSTHLKKKREILQIRLMVQNDYTTRLQPTQNNYKYCIA